MADLTVTTVGSHSHQCCLLFCRQMQQQQQQQQAELDGAAAFESSPVTLPQVNTPAVLMSDLFI